MRPWTVDDVRRAFERVGYQRVTGHARPDRLWYLSSRSTEQAEQYLALDFKPGSKAYGVQVGFSNPAIRRVRSRLSPLVRYRLAPAVQTLAVDEIPCWTMFKPGRALAKRGQEEWRGLVIPTPVNPALGEKQFDDLQAEFLGPLFDAVTTTTAIFECLLRTDIPFEWFSTNPILRAAEAVATAVVCKADIGDVKRQLLSQQSSLPQPIRTGRTWEKSVDSLCEAAHSSLA
jgi:hypothetical protein